MILAAHQPNFLPWLSFFDKMNKSDIFVMMVNCQFEKNGWQNRCEAFGKKWTVPVQSGLKLIRDKKYVHGQRLVTVNEQWINAIALTLNINTSKIRYDFVTESTGTDRIIELCRYYKCNQYLTNPKATSKYLDKSRLANAGIELIPHSFSYKKHTLEAFSELGIQGTQKLLAREKSRCAA